MDIFRERFGMEIGEKTKNVCRKLFPDRPNDTDNNSGLDYDHKCMNRLQNEYLVKSYRYNFDFESDSPKEKNCKNRYEWEPIEDAEVPSFYRTKVHTHDPEDRLARLQPPVNEPEGPAGANDSSTETNTRYNLRTSESESPAQISHNSASTSCLTQTTITDHFPLKKRRRCEESNLVTPKRRNLSRPTRERTVLPPKSAAAK